MPPALWPGASTFPGANTFPGQPSDTWHVLWCSFDDVGTPFQDRTWTDLSSRLRYWETEGGRDSELEEVDAGTALFILDDRDRELDPTNSSSSLAPDVVPNRMMWLRIHADGTSYTEFLGFVDAWGPTWTTSSPNDNQARVRCSDGMKRLNQAEFPFALLDVAEYDELVSALDPSFHYRMGEPQGTKLVSHRRVIRFKKGPKKGKRKRVKRWKTRETRADVSGVSGPAGTYVNSPLLGQPGAIKGDPDKAVEFRSAQSERAIITTDAQDFRGLTGFTVACWVKPSAVPAAAVRYIIVGPATGGSLIFILAIGSGSGLLANGGYGFALDVSAAVASTTPAAVGVWAHLTGTWDGTNIRLYVNGQLEDTEPVAAMANGSDGAIQLAHFDGGFADITLDEVAIFEKALTGDQVEGLYAAAALGFDARKTGQRIWDVLNLNGEFPVWNVHEGTREMPPVRYAGLAPAQLIDEAEEAEGLPTFFYFSREGIPTLRPADYRDSSPFDTASFTFGTGVGELPFLEAQVSDQDAYLYNVIRATIEGGDETIEVSDATSRGRFGPSVLPLDDLPLLDTTELQAFLETLLERYKDPTNRIERFTVAGVDADRREAILTLDLQDCVEVNIPTPPDGTVYTQTSYIERRKRWQSPGEPIMGEFSISPR